MRQTHALESKADAGSQLDNRFNPGESQTSTGDASLVIRDTVRPSAACNVHKLAFTMVTVIVVDSVLLLEANRAFARFKINLNRVSPSEASFVKVPKSFGCPLRDISTHSGYLRAFRKFYG
jgi:hypothetical protein